MFLNYVSPLILYDVERGMASGPMQGNGFHLELIWDTLSYFAFVR